MIISGGDGSQTLVGTPGDDVIYGHSAADADPQSGLIQATLVASGLGEPTFAGAAPGDPDGLYVTEKSSGRIVRVDLGTGAQTTFHDIPASDLSTSGERGLLNLAFHPDYAVNGRFFVFMTDPAGSIAVTEYQRSLADPLVADPAARAVITIPHPAFDNHNGGSLAFGLDGYLYISTGDGGGANDPSNNSQNPNTLLGKILRIDVDTDGFPSDNARNYAIPASNPFAASAGAVEIFALGVRNPWRMTVDNATGDLWIGDVGQGALEEVDVIAAASAGGQNFGWRILEGTRPNFAGSTAGFTAPIFEYTHATGQSITGGYVYHGPAPGLQGDYVFADFVSGRFFSYLPGRNEVVELTDRIVGAVGGIELISSFGLDASGALYVVSITGSIFRLDPSSASTDGNDALYGDAGNDELRGGAGDDVLVGGVGNDQMFGGSGADLLDGGDGSDLFDGGAGFDTASYATANARVIVSLVSGGARGEAVGDAFVFVEALVGSRFGDWLTGDAASNTLTGGRGGDVLRGGRGADDFDYNAFADSGRTQAFRDTILDFQRRADDMDLSTLDANVRKGGNHAFKIIDGQDFHHRAGELHYKDAGRHVIVEGDVNGDGRADFSVLVRNVAQLSGGDFIL